MHLLQLFWHPQPPPPPSTPNPHVCSPSNSSFWNDGLSNPKQIIINDDFDKNLYFLIICYWGKLLLLVKVMVTMIMMMIK